MGREDATFTLGADASSATRSVKDFEKTAAGAARGAAGSFGSLQGAVDKTGGAISSAMGAIKTAAVAAVAIFAGKQVVDFFGAGIDAAVAQEKAMANLAQQMKLTGDFSSDALDQFAAFADTMESTTKYGDDFILSQLAVAKSFGITNEEAQKLVTAATELSAATGKDLESSVKTLGKSLTGTLGPLDDQIVAIKGLTKEQLAHGAAIDAVLARYAGSAAAEINTFSGALTQSGNAWGNLQESIGAVVVNNPVVVAAIKEVTTVLGLMEQFVVDNEDALKSFIAGALNVFLATLGAATEVVGFFGQGLRGLMNVLTEAAGNAAALLSMLPGQEEFEGVAQSIADFQLKADDNFQSLQDGATSVDDAINGIADRINSAAAATVPATDKATTQSGRRRDAYQDEGKAASDAEKAVDALLKKGEQERKVFQDLKGDSALTGSQQMELDAINAQAVAERKAEEDAAKAAAAKAQDDANRQTFSAIGSIVGSGDGRASAEAAAQMLGKGVANAFIPGLGEAVGPILGVLMQGPEATKKFIRDFIAAVPDIITAVAESIPAVVEALVDSLIMDGGALRIGVAIMKAMAGEGVAKSIGKQIGLEFGSSFNSSNIGGTIKDAFTVGADKLKDFPTALNESITRFQDAGKEAGTGLSNAIREAPASIKAGFDEGLKSTYVTLSNAVTEAVGKIGASIRDAVAALALPSIPRPNWLSQFSRIVDSLTSWELPSVGGGGGGLVSGTGTELDKLATGLTEVPSGYENDTYPALLSSGERVVDANANADLKAFLAGGRGGLDGDAIAILARIATLLEKGQVVNTSINIDANELAKAQLKLSRRGARTAA